jgi:hypothetical protein
MSYINSPTGEKKGISVLYAVFIMSILMAISFGISAILISQIKMLGEIGHSVVAFYAADSGIERAMYALYSQGVSPSFINYLGNVGGASYSVSGFEPGTPNCPPPNQYYCIKSIGEYQKTKRAIEASY